MKAIRTVLDRIARLFISDDVIILGADDAAIVFHSDMSVEGIIPKDADREDGVPNNVIMGASVLAAIDNSELMMPIVENFTSMIFDMREDEEGADVR